MNRTRRSQRCSHVMHRPIASRGIKRAARIAYSSDTYGYTSLATQAMSSLACHRMLELRAWRRPCSPCPTIFHAKSVSKSRRKGNSFQDRCCNLCVELWVCRSIVCQLSDPGGPTHAVGSSWQQWLQTATGTVYHAIAAAWQNWPCTSQHQCCK